MKYRIVCRDPLHMINQEITDEAMFAMNAIRWSEPFEADSEYEALQHIDDYFEKWCGLIDPSFEAENIGERLARKAHELYDKCKY